MNLVLPSSRGGLARLNAVLGVLTPAPLVALVLRAGIAAPFFLSGRTKVDGLFALSDSTRYLFAEEYRVPLLSPEFAAWLATGAEHLFPVLIILGLFSRVSALALIGMTLVIQLFVVPGGWPTHLLWLGPLLYLVAHGPGRISLDRLFHLD